MLAILYIRRAEHANISFFSWNTAQLQRCRDELEDSLWINPGELYVYIFLATNNARAKLSNKELVMDC